MMWPLRITIHQIVLFGGFASQVSAQAVRITRTCLLESQDAVPDPGSEVAENPLPLCSTNNPKATTKTAVAARGFGVPYRQSLGVALLDPPARCLLRLASALDEVREVFKVTRTRVERNHEVDDVAAGILDPAKFGFDAFFDHLAPTAAQELFVLAGDLLCHPAPIHLLGSEVFCPCFSLPSGSIRQLLQELRRHVREPGRFDDAAQRLVA
mmetsp:Transcript_12351/g.34712  ORF Transcript_12351/g.34712 Transcript_12351/m.34712 type:complete len:211 (+) Transcript_12351:3-635(+)